MSNFVGKDVKLVRQQGVTKLTCLPAVRSTVMLNFAAIGIIEVIITWYTQAKTGFYSYVTFL